MSARPFTDPPDCTEKCKSSQHADIITAAISKRGVSDTDLCAFLNHICCCCESVRDSVGRTALHVAASCGRLDLVKWLVQNRHCLINAKDTESGYTALHRSIFYGKIDVAVELIKLGANTCLLDANSLTYLEHAMKDGCKPDLINYGGELYVWGTNSNNSVGPQQARMTPELLDVFHKAYPNECVQKICVNQFHSIIVTASGNAYSCGHGRGGRLGLGIESTVVTPKLVTFPVSVNQQGDILACLEASISRDHSLFLDSGGNIYSCGLNTYHVLGIAPVPEKLLIPKQLRHLSIATKGICAARYHSVAWGSKGLCTWGLNAGQLGHKTNNKDEDLFIITPKIVSAVNTTETSIKFVTASDGATIVYTEKGDIYVLHEYQCRKIASRQLNIIQISAIGGKLSSALDIEFSKETTSELKVVALTNTGNLLLWQESDPQLCRCVFSMSRAIFIKQVTINVHEILFVTNDGEALSGVIKSRKKKYSVGETKDKNTEKSAFHKFLEKDDCISLKLIKFPRIHRAISIQSDPKGKDYCVIQAYPYKLFSFPEIAESQIKSHFRILLDEVDETDDIHDVIFKVGNKYFPAHSFIISTRSSYFAKLLNDKPKEVITLNNVNPYVFEQFLQFVYTGYCELMKLGELKNEKLRSLCVKDKENLKHEAVDVEVDPDVSAYEYYSKNKTEKNKEPESLVKNPVRMLHEMAKKFGVCDLQNYLSHLDMHKDVIKSKSTQASKIRPLKFDRLAFTNLCDVTIKCKDDREIKSHKCILAARLEYFNNMFSMRWRGSTNSEITLPFPKGVAEALLEFLYTDSLANLENKDADNLFKILILADQLFVTRLKEQCEFLLTNLLTLKNAVQLLSFAYIYNAEKLKQCSMKFIVSNITPILELRLMDELDTDLLKELTNCYFEEKSEVWCRVITPYSTAVSDEEILKISSNFPVNLDEEHCEKSTIIKSSQKRKSRMHRSSSSSEKNTSTSMDTVGLDSIIQFPDEVQENFKPVLQSHVLNRLKAINLASEKVRDEEIKLKFTSLTSGTGQTDLSSSLVDSSEFPELNSPPSLGTLHHKTPQKYDSKHKMAKLSQKQRKRLSSESNTDQLSSPTSLAESPKNPWKILPEAASPQSSLGSDFNMGDIILYEKKQKENLAKITSKLLVYTQIEDKAIEELHRFYNTESMTDETIVIERVAIGAVASPVWVPRSK